MWESGPHSRSQHGDRTRSLCVCPPSHATPSLTVTDWGDESVDDTALGRFHEIEDVFNFRTHGHLLTDFLQTFLTELT